ncbi:hypothetical protein ACFLTY_04485 [Chloroflexota bacterium]
MLGAGFTRAFLPDAPLLVDYYEIDGLIEKFKAFPDVVNILESEKNRIPDGRINIENLFTRVYNGMPYDSRHDVSALLLSDLKELFMRRLMQARKGVFHSSELGQFAKYCVENRITCITFNYDDVLDQALWEVKKLTEITDDKEYWHPDGGYGFFCRPSICCITDTMVTMDVTAMRLLKLHGSVNWFVRFGSAAPYTIDAIVHNEEWLPTLNYLDEEENPSRTPLREEEISGHLEKDPFIIPPVLVKSAIMEQPVFKAIWRLAYRALTAAQHIVFLGYSMPVTDIASGFLFGEALKKLPASNFKIVNHCNTEVTQKDLEQAYKRVFPQISHAQFEFVDALDWVRELASEVKPS